MRELGITVVRCRALALPYAHKLLLFLRLATMSDIDSTNLVRSIEVFYHQRPPQLVRHV